MSGRAFRGYFSVGEEVTNKIVDNKEGLYLSKDQDKNDPRVVNKLPLYGENLYPKQVP